MSGWWSNLLDQILSILLVYLGGQWLKHVASYLNDNTECGCWDDKDDDDKNNNSNATQMIAKYTYVT